MCPTIKSPLILVKLKESVVGRNDLLRVEPTNLFLLAPSFTFDESATRYRRIVCLARPFRLFLVVRCTPLWMARGNEYVCVC